MKMDIPKMDTLKTSILKMDNRLTKLFACIFFMVCFNSVYIILHEQIHEQICIQAGGTAEIRFNTEKLRVETNCIGWKLERERDLLQLNSLNEIIGYPLIVFLNLFIFGIYTLKNNCKTC